MRNNVSSNSKNKKVLIYRLGSLGDTVIALPCFHKIRESFPTAEITLLTNKPVMTKAAAIEAVLGKTYFFDKILNYPVGTRSLKVLFSLIKEIRHNDIDTLVNINAARSKLSTYRDKLFFRLAGVKNFIGFPQSDADFAVAIDTETGLREWEAKRLSRRINRLGSIALENESYWDLNLDNEEILQGNDALSNLPFGAPILAISLGTKCQSNDWGINNWSLLLKELSMALPNWQLVVLGALDDEATGDICLNSWGQRGLNLCGKIKPRVSAGVLKKASLFIGHDSGPMHLAACVGTPCVGIFSARNYPGQWFPRGAKNAIIYHKVECAGCGLEVCIEKEKKCILSISVEEVKSAVFNTISF